MKRILWDIIYWASREVYLSRKWHHWTLNLGKQRSLGHWPPENISGITLAADFVGARVFFVVRKAELCRIVSLAGFSRRVLLWIEQNWLCSSLKNPNIVHSEQKGWNKLLHISTGIKRDLLEGFMRFFFEICSWFPLILFSGSLFLSCLCPVPVGQPQLSVWSTPEIFLAPPGLTWVLVGARREPLEKEFLAGISQLSFSSHWNARADDETFVFCQKLDLGTTSAGKNLHKTQRLTRGFVPKLIRPRQPQTAILCYF